MRALRVAMRELGYLTVNVALFAALLPARATARVSWSGSFDTLPDEARQRTILLCGWHRHGYLLFIVFGERSPLSPGTRVISHDGPIARMQTRAVEWAGTPLLTFARHSPVPARQQLITALANSPGPVVMLPDSGGPYGVVKPGILEVARAIDAWVVPWTVRSQGCVVVGREPGHVIPLPGCKLELVCGRALTGDERTREQLQRELDRLEAS